jgi:hypothetical protein
MSDRQRGFLEALEPMNVEARYPTEVTRLASQLDDERCRAIIQQTQELYEWIKAAL